MMRNPIEQRSAWFFAFTSNGNNGKLVEDMCLWRDGEGMGKWSCGERMNHDHTTHAYLRAPRLDVSARFVTKQMAHVKII